MTHTPHQDPAVLTDEERAAWVAPLPPPDFVARVMAAQEAALRRRRVAQVSMLAAAGVLWAVAAPRLSMPVDGALHAEAREEMRLGTRAVAVAEAGASLRFEVGATGEAHVWQDRGRVFYRVERGGSFSVQTPAGTVNVLGTCFDVEVTTPNKETNVNTIRAGVVGAAVGAAVVVGVYEGRVALANGHGRVEAAAGQRAQAQASAAPQVEERVERAVAEAKRLRQDRDALQLQLDDAETQMRRVVSAQAAGKPGLETELEHLRAQVRSLQDARKNEREAQAAQEGKPMPFPKDIAERYREDGFRRAFTEAMSEAGLPGDIKSVDCTEFPCVVYGDVSVPGDRAELENQFSQLREAIAKRFPKEENAHGFHVHSSSEKGPDGTPRTTAHFGVTAFPKDVVSEEEKGAFDRRQRFRTQEYMDSVVP